MKIMRMTSPMASDELSAAIVGLVKANEIRGDCYIQPLAYFGEGTPGYLPAQERPGEVTIVAREAGPVLGSVSASVSSSSRLA